MKDYTKEIRAYKPQDGKSGFLITFTTQTSRKSFKLPCPASPESSKPLAVESFALHPDKYFEWMTAVQNLNRSPES